MILTVCVDDRLGISFGGRRQSKDSAVRQKLLELCGGSVRMSDYSARQFEEGVYHGSDYLSGADDGDWCFMESADYDAFADKIEKIILFRWNRHYPSDVQFRFPGKWALVQSTDFPGSSHEKITMEVYEKCE
jgi:hypothetical protein